MNSLVAKVIETAQSNGLMPVLPEEVPLPSINKVELYLSFHGNDSCAHCITSSGPHRNTLLHPEAAKKAVVNIANHSILNTLSSIFQGGVFKCSYPPHYDTLDSLSAPPQELSDQLIMDYADAIMGKHHLTEWNSPRGSFLLNFGRPSIRISGGEFYTWPNRLDNQKLTEDERLFHQNDLLRTIRERLPEYDIWILTNGRFAEDKKKADSVVRAWSPEKDRKQQGGGKTRLVVSVDPFHRPPQGSSVEEMLDRLWDSSLCHLGCAPHIYSIANKKLFLVGRALNNFQRGPLGGVTIKNVSKSGLNHLQQLNTDPNNLVETDGCDELKGFICQTPVGGILVNNIVVNDNGNLAYCCVCVGDYGDFIDSPVDALKQMLKDPISLMLRNGNSAEKLLNLAVELDPTIKVFGNSCFDRATGSTCYQLLSGNRVAN